jgi:hypothetical protein
MFDIKGEIEKLECCASECALISDLATDRRARKKRGSLLLPTGSKQRTSKRSPGGHKHRKAPSRAGANGRGFLRGRPFKKGAAPDT